MLPTLPISLLTPAFSSGYVGPLDVQSGAILAFGQRALSAAMRGFALYTIREDLGNTTHTFDSNASTGEAPSAAITSFIGSGNGFITTWAGQNDSGSTANVLNTDSASQPQWLANITNSKPSAFLNSNNDANTVLLATALGIAIPASGVTAFLCLKPIANSAGSMSIIGGGDENGPGWNVGLSNSTGPSGIVLDNYSGASDEMRAVSTETTVFGAVHVLDVQLATNVANYFLDGTELTTASGGTGVATDVNPQFVIGSDDVLLPDVAFYNGYVLEVIVYPSLLANTPRANVRQNIANWYGVTLA